MRAKFRDFLIYAVVGVGIALGAVVYGESGVQISAIHDPRAICMLMTLVFSVFIFAPRWRTIQSTSHQFKASLLWIAFFLVHVALVGAALWLIPWKVPTLIAFAAVDHYLIPQLADLARRSVSSRGSQK